MKITTRGDNLIIQLEGVERLWAFKTGLNIKRHKIDSIIWSFDKPHWRNMIAVRSPGTGLPKVLYAGTFFSARRGWEFWYLKMQQPGFLVISTSDDKYTRIRLTASQAVHIKLQKWLDSGVQPGEDKRPAKRKGSTKVTTKIVSKAKSRKK